MLNIFTLSWQGEEKLKKLVPGLLSSLNGIDFQWFIKDNNSNDGSIDYLKSLENNNIKIIQYKNNLQNFSAGMNYLFVEAAPKDDDLIMLLNNDVVFNDNQSIKNMIKIIDNDKDVGMVGARLLYPDSNRLQHGGVVFMEGHMMPVHFRANQTSDDNAEKNRSFQSITAAVCITKSEYFKNICKNASGVLGMDENYHWAFDDVDACLSIKYNMNKKIIYCGKTNISHEESASLKKMPNNKLFMPHNKNYLLRKWKGRYQLDRQLYDNDPKFGLY